MFQWTIYTPQLAYPAIFGIHRGHPTHHRGHPNQAPPQGKGQKNPTICWQENVHIIYKVGPRIQL